MKVMVPFWACFFLLAAAAQQKTQQNSDTLTVRGCLKHTRQNYIVVDRQGFVYALKGVGNKLDGDVGHQVEVAGTLTNDVKTGIRSEKLGSNPSDTVRGVWGATLQVRNVSADVRSIADHCPAN